MNATEAPRAASHDRLSDDDLMRQIDAGDAGRALDVLQTRYLDRVLRLVTAILQDEHLAQDVAQEVFFKVFTKSHLYQIGTNFRAWLMEIARNQALTALRVNRRSPLLASNLGDREECGGLDLDRFVGAVESHELEEREFLDAFATAVGALPDRYRDIFKHCVMLGHTYADAAQCFELPPGTVAIRIMRARKRLFDELRHHLGRMRRPPACAQS